MATKSKMKMKSKASTKATVKKSKPTAVKAKTTKKPVTSKKAAPAKKVAAKKVAPKAPAKKPVAKAVQPKVAAKLADKIGMKPVERKTLDRAPTMENKAPMNVVARPQRPAYVVPASQQVQGAKKNNFAVGEYVVYPTHGVGRIMGHESEKIGDFELKLFVISFEKDKMTLRVPTGRAEAALDLAERPDQQSDQHPERPRENCSWHVEPSCTGI